MYSDFFLAFFNDNFSKKGYLDQFLIAVNRGLSYKYPKAFFRKGKKGIYAALKFSRAACFLLLKIFNVEIEKFPKITMQKFSIQKNPTNCDFFFFCSALFQKNAETFSILSFVTT